MTNPDNVGGPDDHVPVPLSEELRVEAAMHSGDTTIRGIALVKRLTRWASEAEFMERRITELCRASPAGGDDLYRQACESVEEWKARALEAEADIARIHAQINAENGPTFMGEPVASAPTGGGVEYSDRVADLIGGSGTPVVCEDGDANCTLWDILANAFGDDDIGNAREWLREAVYEAARTMDSAPAGSGEVDENIDGLCCSLEFMAKHSDSVGFNSDAECLRTAAALLRKLQQGAGNG